MAKQNEQMATHPRLRNVGVRRVMVRDLVDHELNYREHPHGQREAFSATVRELGWYGYPDVYEQPDGTLKLIDGHLRKEELIASCGEDAEIDVNVTDMTDEEARKAILTHDPLSALAELDGEALGQLIAETDFDSAALRRMVDDLRLSVPEEDDIAALLSGEPTGDVDVDKMELQPEEHYDFILILADNVNDWNRLVRLFDLPHVQSGRTHKRIGIARAVRAEKVLGMIDEKQTDDSDTDA